MQVSLAAFGLDLCQGVINVLLGFQPFGYNFVSNQIDSICVESLGYIPVSGVSSLSCSSAAFSSVVFRFFGVLADSSAVLRFFFFTIFFADFLLQYSSVRMEACGQRNDPYAVTLAPSAAFLKLGSCLSLYSSTGAEGPVYGFQ